MTDCAEALSAGCTPPQLFGMARRLLLALFAASPSPHLAAALASSAELCELAIALYDAHLAAHCLGTTEEEVPFLSAVEKDEVTRDIFNRIAAMAIVAASRPGGRLELVRVSCKWLQCTVRSCCCLMGN